jgi:phosphatidylserine/phosphatidylglycerophosphate/cardiolipin synthase-like enzyme
VHNKVILIDGVYQGVTNQKIVYTTSQNLTMTSLRESNEVMLRIPIPSVYQAYLDNFVDIRGHAVRVRSTAAKTTAGVNSASEESNGKAPSDNSPDPDE